MREDSQPYLERDVFATYPNLKFLLAILVPLWPFRIVFLHDLACLDNSFDL